MLGTWVRSLMRDDPHAAEQLSPFATTTDACAAWSPCSTRREATAMENPCTREQPPLDTIREKPVQQ